jgi:hypothetical protein
VDEIVVYENERRDESGTFSSEKLLKSDPLSFANSKGQLAPSPEATEPPNGWEWTNKWADEPWQYSDKFSGNKWTENIEGSVVRRRRWVRRCRRMGSRQDGMMKTVGGTSSLARKQPKQQETLSPIEAFERFLTGSGGRIDREKLEIIQQYIAASDVDETDKRNTISKEVRREVYCCLRLVHG